jgi:hypothetical protein
VSHYYHHYYFIHSLHSLVRLDYCLLSIQASTTVCIVIGTTACALTLHFGGYRVIPLGPNDSVSTMTPVS